MASLPSVPVHHTEFPAAPVLLAVISAKRCGNAQDYPTLTTQAYCNVLLAAVGKAASIHQLTASHGWAYRRLKRGAGDAKTASGDAGRAGRLGLARGTRRQR